MIHDIFEPEFVEGYANAERHLISYIGISGLRYALDYARTEIPRMKARPDYQNAFGAGTIEAFEDFFDRHTKGRE